MNKRSIHCFFFFFDNVWRNDLWFKKQQNGVNEIFSFFSKKNLYEELKSLISLSSFISFISCNVGVRQGENLSPVLFPFPALDGGGG